MSAITYNTSKLSNGVNAFYVEAGDKSLPTLLLLHGYPSSARQFARIIPYLEQKFHLIAPDLPTFGLTTLPDDFDATFENIASTVELLLDQLNIKSFSVYIFDYGAPTGLRLALNPKFHIEAIISQNGNAYEEGLAGFWDPLKVAWKQLEETGSIDKKLETALTDVILKLEYYQEQYESGEPDPSRVNPEDAIIDHALLVAKRHTGRDQLQLFLDYRNNVKLYPKFHQYFAETNVPILAVWGTHDYIFGPAGQEAYKRHSKNVKLVHLDAGHFAGVSHAAQVASEIVQFYSQYVNK